MHKGSESWSIGQHNDDALRRTTSNDKFQLLNLAVKWSVAVFIFALTASVKAAEVSNSGISGEISILHGFKPEYFPGQGSGQYDQLTGKIRYKPAAGDLRFSLSQSLVVVKDPEESLEILDPVIGGDTILVSAQDHGINLLFSTALKPGVSQESVATHLQGVVQAKTTLVSRHELVSFFTSAGLSKYFYRYTLNSTGSHNRSEAMTGTMGAEAHLPWSLSFQADLSYTKTNLYEGDASFFYENSFSLTYEATESLSLELSLSTTDAQLQPDGSTNNSLTLYKRNQSEMTIQASLSL